MRKVRLFLRRLLPGQEQDESPSAGTPDDFSFEGGDSSSENSSAPHLRIESQNVCDGEREGEHFATLKTTDTSLILARERASTSVDVLLAPSHNEVRTSARQVLSRTRQSKEYRSNDNRTCSTEIKVGSPVPKADFGQTVHPRSVDIGPLTSSIGQSKLFITAKEKQTLAVVRPLKTVAVSLNQPTKATDRPGLVPTARSARDDNLENTKRKREVFNFLAQLNHSMQTQTSFEANAKPNQPDLAEWEASQAIALRNELWTRDGSCQCGPVSNMAEDIRTSFMTPHSQDTASLMVNKSHWTERQSLERRDRHSDFEADSPRSKSDQVTRLMPSEKHVSTKKKEASLENTNCTKDGDIQPPQIPWSENTRMDSCVKTTPFPVSTADQYPLSTEPQQKCTEIVRELMLHSRSCANNCKALPLPHDKSSKLSKNGINFSVERSKHDGHYGLLISPESNQQNEHLLEGTRTQEISECQAKLSEQNFLTVRLDEKGLQTVDINVMSCISWSNIPNDLYLTDSLGLPVPEARLTVIPYPCPCHPLDQIIKNKRPEGKIVAVSRKTVTPRSEKTIYGRSGIFSEDKSYLKTSNTIHWSNTSVDCQEQTLSGSPHSISSYKITDKSPIEFSPEVESTSAAGETNIIQDLQFIESKPESYQTNQLRLSGKGSLDHTIVEAKTISSSKTKLLQQVQHSPEKISVRSLAAIAGQGVFKTVKDSATHPVMVTPPTNAFISFTPPTLEQMCSIVHEAVDKEYECNSISNDNSVSQDTATKTPKAYLVSGPVDNKAAEGPLYELSVTRAENYKNTDHILFNVEDQNLALTRKYSPTEFTAESSVNFQREASGGVPKNSASSFGRSLRLIVSRGSQTNRPVLKASRRSKITLETRSADLTFQSSKLEYTQERTKEEMQPRTTSACDASVDMGGCNKSESTERIEQQQTNVWKEVDKTTERSFSDSGKAEDFFNSVADPLLSNQTARKLQESVRNTNMMTKRPSSRKGREGYRGVTRRGPKQFPPEQREQARRAPDLHSSRKKYILSEDSKFKDNERTVESLWVSQWTEKSFPSSKSIIRVSGDGSNLTFDYDDVETSAQSIQLNVADIEGNHRFQRECERDNNTQQVLRDKCIQPLSAGSFSDEGDEEKEHVHAQHTIRQPVAEVAPLQQVKTIMAKAGRNKETTRFRAPFSLRSKKLAAAVQPEPNVAMFECVICTDYLSPPVRQCITGHRLCPSCLKGTELCPICRLFVPMEPNKVLDSMVRAVLFPCKNSGAGCKESYWIEDRSRHEGKCPYRPRPCPFATRSQVLCEWSGLRGMIRGHMKRAHGHHGTIYPYKTFFPLEEFNLAAWTNRTYHVEIVFVEHEIFELHKVFDKRNTCLWGLLRHILARDSSAQFSYAIRFQPANMRPNVTFRNDAVSGAEDLDKAFAQGKRFNLHLDCFTQNPLDIFTVQVKVQPIDRNKWP